MIYIGIDPSYSATGIVAYKDKELIFAGELTGKISKDKQSIEMKVNNTVTTYPYTLEMKAELAYGEYERIMLLHKMLYNIIFQILGQSVNFTVCIEVPMGSHLGAGGKIDRAYTATLFTLREVHTYLLNMANIKKIPPTVPTMKINIVAPTHLKKTLTGKGNANKEAMVAACAKQGFVTKSHNIADAWGLCKIAREL